jgi:hypothetical protein
MKTTTLTAAILVVALALGCLPEDKERCHGDYVWNAKLLMCDLKKSAKKQDAAEEIPPAEETDAEVSEGGENELPSGLGKECTDESQCAKYQEKACTANSYIPTGYCTLRCSKSATKCPTGYSCCISPDESLFPSTCLKNEQYESLDSMGYCRK